MSNWYQKLPSIVFHDDLADISLSDFVRFHLTGKEAVACPNFNDQSLWIHFVRKHLQERYCLTELAGKTLDKDWLLALHKRHDACASARRRNFSTASDSTVAALRLLILGQDASFVERATRALIEYDAFTIFGDSTHIDAIRKLSTLDVRKLLCTLFVCAMTPDELRRSACDHPILCADHFDLVLVAANSFGAALQLAKVANFCAGDDVPLALIVSELDEFEDEQFSELLQFYSLLHRNDDNLTGLLRQFVRHKERLEKTSFNAM